jgi:hypothetical protein
MRFLMICLTAGFILSGCAAKVVSSNPRTVVIDSPSMSVSDAQKLADKECSKHNRYARIYIKPVHFSSEFVFDCVQ